MANGALIVSEMAENLIGSEIIKLAGEVNAKIRNGEKIYNLTIGDFNPKIFPIPQGLRDEIIRAYENNETNYPPADGIADLRIAVSSFLQEIQGLEYNADEILIAGGARPIIYAIFKALLDPGDAVLFPVPSWNNNHYCHLSSAQQVLIETRPENNFMPTAADLRPHISKVNLLALCSPLNPTGTVFTREGLNEICQLVVEENRKRRGNGKPIYIMYDQIYNVLTYGTEHHDPVTLHPELRDYTIYVDGISKSFAATGIRVGWGFGPKRVIDKMKSILGHVGAWAPKAEQVATARYLQRPEEVRSFLDAFKKSLEQRLSGFYNGFQQLKKEGFSVDAIAPQAALYLTVKIELKGKSTHETTKYLLDEAKIALVPFHAFGSPADSSWYRLSVGTATMDDIHGVINNLRSALQKV